jgi:drug/metabolite transporter (DMT)-like permease
MSDILTPAALGMLMLEGLKELWRKFVAKDPFYEFPPRVLAVLLVAFTYLAVPLLALLQVGDYPLPTDWVDFVRKLVVAILTAIVASALYVTGLRPFRVYAREYRAMQANSKSFKKMKK